MECVHADVAVIGGGPGGVCAALSAARLGLSVILVGNRPVLGGNSSSEIRVWTRGAVGAGNLFAEEMGVWGLLKLENLYKNPEANPVFWDEILLDNVLQQKNLQLYLNTDITDICLNNGMVSAVTGHQQGTEKALRIEAAFFIDATGDGTLGAKAGISYYMGDRRMTGDNADNAEAPSLLGSSILYYTRQENHPVAFVPPAYAYDKGGRTMFQKTAAFRIFFVLAFVCIGFFVFFPLLWLINTALKPTTETFSSYFFTGPLTLENIARIIGDPKIMTYLKNSLIVSFGSSFMATLVCSFAGYSFAKFRYRGRKFTMGLFMMSQAFPQAILLLSIYSLMNSLGLLGSYWALLVSYVVFTLPVGTWTLKGCFDQIPDALIESAKIDGAGHWRIMTRIVFPMAVPGMVSIAIYGFVWSWNDLLYSMTLVTGAERRTLASGLVMTFLGEASTNWGYMMAASVVAAIPVTIIFVFLQRYFIQGLTAGAVKG